jgi:hypothetical protein
VLIENNASKTKYKKVISVWEVDSDQESEEEKNDSEEESVAE